MPGGASGISWNLFFVSCPFHAFIPKVCWILIQHCIEYAFAWPSVCSNSKINSVEIYWSLICSALLSSLCSAQLCSQMANMYLNYYSFFRQSTSNGYKLNHYYMQKLQGSMKIVTKLPYVFIKIISFSPSFFDNFHHLWKSCHNSANIATNLANSIPNER